MNGESKNPIVNEIWSLIKKTQENIAELHISQKETAEQSKKTQENIAELHISQKEIAEQSKKTQENIAEQSKKTQENIAELRIFQKETAEQLRKTDDRFGFQWGRLVEVLVEGDLKTLLKKRNIEVTTDDIKCRKKASYTTKNGEFQQTEFDILTWNKTQLVAIEAKSFLKPDDVTDFLTVLKDFKKYLPTYKAHTIYGAVGYLKCDGEADLYAQRKGLFVIRAVGSSASIINKKDFKPKVFS